MSKVDPIPLHLPYFAPNLPHQLPSEHEICAAPRFDSVGSQNVVHINQRFVVKFGKKVSPIEADNMVFVRNHTTLRVPEVYAAYRNETGCMFIVMEYIPGETLSVSWAGLSDIQKRDITATIKSYFSELRSLPSPGYYGSIGHRGLLDPIFQAEGEYSGDGGPFSSESELNEAILTKQRCIKKNPHRTGYYKAALAQVFVNHPPMFTHNDFRRKNIMIQFNDHEDVGEGGRNVVAVTLIDWQESGWLPSYWEFSKTGLGDRLSDDWHSYVQQMLDPYWSELPWLTNLFEELWS